MPARLKSKQVRSACSPRNLAIWGFDRNFLPQGLRVKRKSQFQQVIPKTRQTIHKTQQRCFGSVQIKVKSSSYNVGGSPIVVNISFPSRQAVLSHHNFSPPTRREALHLSLELQNSLQLTHGWGRGHSSLTLHTQSPQLSPRSTETWDLPTN